MEDNMATDLEKRLEGIRSKKAFICDMDGVIYHGNRLLDGVKHFIDWLQEHNKEYLFLTNSSERSPMELQQKLSRLGLTIDKRHFYTSALATASFLKSQSPEGSAYVIGEAGLINAMYEVGYTMNDISPDYVVMGESRTYSLQSVTHAVNLVRKGARLVGTNPDLNGPIENGIMPGTGALISPVSLATGVTPYFVGKPNPLMMRHALKRLGVKREDTVIIGDRMDTDVISGIEAEIDTVLVLTGVSTRETVKQYAYRPTIILEGVKDIAYETT